MVVIVPIFIKKDDIIWSTNDGKGLLRKFFFSVKNADSIKKLFVFTNDSFIFDFSISIGIDTCFISINPENENSELLPYGTHSSINYLDEVLKLDFDDLMILSFRNPLVTPHLIDNAIKEYYASNMTSLISICKSIDHPVQLDAYYQITDAGFIHLFDNDLTSEDFNVLNDVNFHFKITRSFYFDWPSKGIKQKSSTGIYSQICDGLNIKYIPVDKMTDNESSKSKFFPLWIWDSWNSARILVPFNNDEIISNHPAIVDKNYELYGMSFNCDPYGISILLFQNTDKAGSILVLNGENIASFPLLIKYKPMSLSDEFRTEMKEIEIQNATASFPFRNTRSSICGIAYTILGVAKNSSYDLCEPFPSNAKLWTGDSPKINMKTGKQITGRQDFPEVFEPDGTFFITRKNLIPNFEKEILSGNVRGFNIDMANSIQIGSKFDLLRCKALSKIDPECYH